MLVLPIPERSILARRTTRRSLLLGAGALGVEATYLGASAVMSACGEPSTGGKRVTITTRGRGDVADHPVVENAFGWSIEVTRARVAFDTLYYVAGPPAGIARHGDGFFSIPNVHAHPGHYDSGDVLAELQGPVSLDLLAPETTLGRGGGVTGLARSGIVTLGSLGGDDGTQCVVVEGVASQAETAIRFRAAVERSAIDHPTSHLPEIDGCPMAHGEIESDGTILLEVGVAVWLDNIDFAQLGTPESGLVVLEPETPPHNALRRGIAKAMGYEFAYFPA